MIFTEYLSMSCVLASVFIFPWVNANTHYSVSRGVFRIFLYVALEYKTFFDCLGLCVNIPGRTSGHVLVSINYDAFTILWRCLSWNYYIPWVPNSVFCLEQCLNSPWSKCEYFLAINGCMYHSPGLLVGAVTSRLNTKLQSFVLVGVWRPQKINPDTCNGLVTMILLTMFWNCLYYDLPWVPNCVLCLNSVWILPGVNAKSS